MRYRAGSVYKRPESSKYWISYYIDGKQIREPAKTENRKEAERFLAERIASAKPPDKRSVGQLLDQLVKYFEINEKSSWGPLVVRVHLKPYFGQIKADQITKQNILEYIQKRKADKKKNGTINRELTLLRRAFKLAEMAHPKIPKLEENNVRTGFLSPEQFERLITELPEHVRPIALFGYLTGCRKGEILNLKWSQVDIERRIVKLAATDTKSGLPRTIPLSESIADTLDALPRVDEHVFTRAGKQVKDIREAWASACARAGIPNVQFHDLRRTAVRNLVRANVPERIAMDISGHKTRSIFDRYNIIVETELHDAMAKVENRFTQFERTAVAKAATNNGVDRFLVPKDAIEHRNSDVPTGDKEVGTITVTITANEK